MTRGEALKILDTIPTIGEQVDALEMAIKALEQPERKTGKWIEEDDATVRGHCSLCGWESHYYEDDVIGMPFCPNCGADMRGEQE